MLAPFPRNTGFTLFPFYPNIFFGGIGNTKVSEKNLGIEKNAEENIWVG
jgi:hypothetical protein